MNPSPSSPPARNVVASAFAVAIIVDVLQLPVTLVTATGIGAIPGELADIALDVGAMIVISRLLGFHWVLIPTLFAKAVPGLDLIPTWTGAVAFLVWQRGKQGPQGTASSPPTLEKPQPFPARTAPSGPIIDAELVPPPRLNSPPLPVAPASSPEDRLHKLADLRQRGLITDEEHTAKRRQILNEL